MLNTLARMLYEGERFEWAEAGTSSWLTNTHDVNDIMFGITVDRSVFWRRFAELQKEHGWSCDDRLPSRSVRRRGPTAPRLCSPHRHRAVTASQVEFGGDA
jgi:hypothetical protein